MLLMLIIIEGAEMIEKEKLNANLYCFCEKKEKKLIYTVYDKNGNYATSTKSHQEATNYLNQRKPII